MRLSVCLSVYMLARLLKTRAWIRMTFCVLTGVGAWTNWSTFEPDPDHSPDAGTALLSPISYAVQRGILLRRENPTYRYWAWLFGARRSSDAWFWGVETPLSEVNALYWVPFQFIFIITVSESSEVLGRRWCSFIMKIVPRTGVYTEIKKKLSCRRETARCIMSLKVSQGHGKWYHSKAWYGFLFAFHSNYGSILYNFRKKRDIGWKLRFFILSCI